MLKFEHIQTCNDMHFCDTLKGVIVPLHEVISMQSTINPYPVYAPHVNQVDFIDK